MNYTNLIVIFSQISEGQWDNKNDTYDITIVF